MCQLKEKSLIVKLKNGPGPEGAGPLEKVYCYEYSK
jgi:hypothetical protein